MKKRKQKGNGRIINLQIRVTPEELEHLKKCAEEDGSARLRGGRVNYSSYCRKHLLSETNYKNEELIRIQKRLAYEMRKIGVNINQATKRINAWYGLPSDAYVLKEKLEEVERLFVETMEECGKLWESQS